MLVTQNCTCKMSKHKIECINCKSMKWQPYCNSRNTNYNKNIEVTCRKIRKKKIIPYSCVIGRVSNNKGFPIKNILIKLFNIDKNVTTCVSSDDYGYFCFERVSLYEKFKIYAIDEFNNKSNQEEFILLDTCPKSIDLFINIKKTSYGSIIVGDIFNFKTCNPIENIAVSLFKRTINCNLELDYIVYTNKYGQFAFRDVCNGEYIVKTSSIGYKPKIYRICINEHSKIINLQIELYEDDKNQNGSLSGLITDKNNEAVDYGDVILYKVDNSSGYEKLIPIAFTKTNNKGIYSFINVPKGTYKIKATKTSDF